MTTARSLARVCLTALMPLAMVPLAVWAQTGPPTVRCESADGKSVIYLNQPCPRGFHLVRPVGSPPTALPAPEAPQRAQREADLALSLETRRRQRALPQDGVLLASQPRLRQRQSDAVQRTADCSYLQGEINATRRMRDLLEPRPYYSYEDAEMIRGIIAQLSDEYRLLCSP